MLRAAAALSVASRGAILLVDDEESTIEVENLMLRELGYTVLPARSGKEAVELYKANASNLDLVALDVIMPDMNGKETYDELKKVNPDFAMFTRPIVFFL